VAANRKYPDELRVRAVRLYRESDPKPVIAQLARQLNVGRKFRNYPHAGTGIRPAHDGVVASYSVVASSGVGVRMGVVVPNRTRRSVPW
jgi:hypothetical protein